jgi:hypothetical protein
MAHASDGIEARQIELFRDNIRRFVVGLPLRNVVNKSAGF